MKKESVMQKLFTYAGNYKYLTICVMDPVCHQCPDRIIAVLLYLADHAGSGAGSTGLQQGPESVGAWMECRGICAAFHAHLYLRPAVFPHCRLSRTGQYAKHSDASYSDAAHGIHGQ